MDGDIRGSGAITDLSTSGAYVETPVPAKKGAFIEIKFQIGTITIEATGMVIRQTPGLKGMGICFRSLTSEQRSAIEKIVRQT